MSVESDIRTALLANAPLAALIGARLAPDKIVQGAARPYIVYIVQREPVATLDGVVRSTLYKFRFQVWDDTRAGCEAAADALETALTAATGIQAVSGIPIDSRETIAEHELDLEGTEITFEHWRDA